MTFGQYKVYFVLIVLAMGSWLLAGLFDKDILISEVAVEHSPDYFSVGYYKKEMTEQGVIKNELVADKMTHYADDGTTHLENPSMVLHNENEAPWIIEAGKGVLAADGDNLSLSEQVSISKKDRKTKQLFKINTAKLQVQLETSYAETDVWAEIIDGPNRTEGIGMTSTFKSPIKVKFLSKVKGRYVFN